MNMKALAGLKVLDLTTALNGPFCTTMLADHGADVIKFEIPTGEQSRAWGPLDEKSGESGFYAFLNRNKKGCTLNLKNEKARQMFYELVKDADVVVENYRPGVTKKLGVDYETLKEINPKIIYASGSGFGQYGPISHRPCYDIVAQSMGGMVNITGFQDGPPVKVGPSVADHVAGIYLSVGVLLALYHREKTGEGQQVDVSMPDTIFTLLENSIVKTTMQGIIPERQGNIDPSISPFDIYATSDGYIALGINVLVARYLGKGDVEEANNIVSHGLLLSFVFGTLLSILFFIVLKPYFALYINEPKILELCMEYMNICVFIQLPNMVHIAIQKVLQGTGNMLAPMGFQIAGVVLNFILDPVLIRGIGPFPEMGVSGAAVSTVLGYTLSMLIAFYILIFTKQKVKIKTKAFVFQITIWKDIFCCGIPSFIMNALGAFMVTMTNSFLVVYSTTAVAFFGAYFKAQQLIVMTVNGLIQGCIPIMSFNYGAGNTKRLKETFLYGTAIAVFLMTIGASILMIFPRQILKIFLASDDMLSFGIPALRIMATGFMFNGVATMVASYMQSMNRIKSSILINIMRQCGILFPTIWILTKWNGLKIQKNMQIWIIRILKNI